MNKPLLIAGASILTLGLILFFSMTSWYDKAISLENTTKAQFLSNKNTYDNFWKTVKETAQVPDKYKEDFKQLLVAETTAKFGPDGSKATFQWFQDRQINFDASQYRKIQDVIESGRQDFKRSQNELLDKQRKVADLTQSFWGRMGASFFDFPREMKGAAAPPRDLDGDNRLTVLDYPIVTSAKTDAAFQSGQDEALNVFGK